MIKKKALVSLAIIPFGLMLVGCNPSYLEPLEAYTRITSECSGSFPSASASISTLSEEKKQELGECISKNLADVNMSELANLINKQPIPVRERFCDESWELIRYLDPKVEDTFNDVCAELILETT